MRDLCTKAHRHDGTTAFACLLCGTPFQQHWAAVGLFDGEDELGDICPTCLGAGPEGAAGRAKARAARMRTAADELVELADHIGRIASWATPGMLLEEEASAHDEFVAALVAEELHHKENNDAEAEVYYDDLLLTVLL